MNTEPDVEYHRVEAILTIYAIVLVLLGFYWLGTLELTFNPNPPGLS